MCMNISGEKSMSTAAKLVMTATISYTTSHSLSAFSWAEHKTNPLFFFLQMQRLFEHFDINNSCKRGMFLQCFHLKTDS